MPHETPAGWYPAPHANNEPRYWDGQRWYDAAPTVAEVPAMPAPGPDAMQVPPAQPGPDAQQAPPFQPNGAAPGARSRKLALAALFVGIAAFLTGLVPVLGLLLALGGVALGISALVKKQQKNAAITGLALGSVALLTGIIATSAALAGPGTTATEASVIETAEATAEVSEPAEPTEEAAAPETSEPEPAASEAPVATGTIENPAPQPHVAKGFLGGEKYSLTAKIVDANAGALVEQWNMFNDEAPAGFKYVVAELSMTGIDPDGVEPSLASYDLSLATPEGNRYDSEYVVFGDGMPSMNDGPTLYPGSSFTGYTAYIVPEAAQSFVLYDNGEYIAF